MIFGVFYYLNYVAPFNRTIISVDDTRVTMRYFLDRTRMAGQDPLQMLQKITEEQIIRVMAPEYGIEVTDAEVDAALRQLAGSDSESLSEVEFREWYRQQLNTYGVTDSQFKDLLYIRMLTARMEDYLANQVPDVTEQVHIYWIVVPTLEEAEEAIERLDAGETFTELAKEISVDELTKEQGGDLGWFPPAAFNYREEIAGLSVNEYTSPIPHLADSSSDTAPTIDSYFIFMVSEKDPARELDEYSRLMLQSVAVDDWYNNEIKNHDIKYNFDSEIYSWLTYQLQKSTANR